MLIDLLKQIDLSDRARGLNYRAQGYNTQGILKPLMLSEIVLKSSGNCSWCGKRIIHGDDAEFDHVLPFRLQGENTPDNLTLSCADCNRHKAEKHPARFAQEQASKGIDTPFIQFILNRYDIDGVSQQSLFDD